MKSDKFNIFQDWSANSGNSKGRIILILFRLAHIGSINRFLFCLLIPYLIFYRVVIEWTLGCEIPYKTVIGPNLTLYHGQSTVINDSSIIGYGCTIRHCTTIGNKKNATGYSLSPTIGNNVDIGSNTCIIGPILIGDFVVIGSGSIVVKSLPSNVTVAGNPARILKQHESTFNS